MTTRDQEIYEMEVVWTFRQVVHAIDSRAGEGEIPKMFEAQKIVTESQMSDTEPQY